MAGKVTITPSNNWLGEMEKTLTNALAVSMQVMGRTGADACKHALILMAQSARAITPKAKNKRQVHKDEHGAYVDYYKHVEGGQVSRRAVKYYKWMFESQSGAKQNETLNTIMGRNFMNWDWARRINHSGLAKRSWMWGLKGAERKPIPGTCNVFSIQNDSTQVYGYIKENKLSYITKIMPAGWEQAVAQKATNKIMKQAAMKMERAWRGAIARRDRAAGVAVRTLFAGGI